MTARYFMDKKKKARFDNLSRIAKRLEMVPIDVFGWWKNVGMLRFPKIAVAASILLAKPFHNGYQERIFSRGTFTDNILRKRLREEQYEMRVLEGLTRHKITGLFNSIVKDAGGETPVASDARVVQEFFETGKRKRQYPVPVPIVLPQDIREVQADADCEVSSLEEDEFSVGSKDSEEDKAVNSEFYNIMVDEDDDLSVAGDME